MAPEVTADQEPRVPQLTEQLEKDLVQVFKLLADETRLKILFFLGREKELHVSALCERLGQSQPAVSHHLALLRVAGLIEPRRGGKHNFYSIQQGRFHQIMGELFHSFTDDGNTELRFEDFIFRQDRDVSSESQSSENHVICMPLAGRCLETVDSDDSHRSSPFQKTSLPELDMIHSWTRIRLNASPFLFGLNWIGIRVHSRYDVDASEQPA